MKAKVGFILAILLLGTMMITPMTLAEDLTIGYSTWTMDYTFFQNMTKGIKNAAENQGWDVKVVEAKMDAQKQISDVESLLVQGIDALIISPVDPPSIAPAVHTAKDRGIPVVIADIGGSGPYDAIVISDNYQGGVKAAKYMAEKLDNREDISKKVAAISTQPEYKYSYRRHKGFMDEIEKLGYTVVAELVPPPTTEGGYNTMQAILSAHSDISGVFVGSGREAVGASRAIIAADKDPVEEIMVIGFNADPEEIEAMRDGRQAATIMQQPAKMGEKAVEITKELLNGAEMEQKEFLAPIKLITPENIDEYFPPEKSEE